MTTDARVTSINGPDGSAVLGVFTVGIQLPAMPLASPLVPVPPRLAHTGADATSGVSAALTLLLSGLVLMLLGRSRRRKEIAR